MAECLMEEFPGDLAGREAPTSVRITALTGWKRPGLSTPGDPLIVLASSWSSVSSNCSAPLGSLGQVRVRGREAQVGRALAHHPAGR